MQHAQTTGYSYAEHDPGRQRLRAFLAISLHRRLILSILHDYALAFQQGA
jgi:hypothetical protein